MKHWLRGTALFLLLAASSAGAFSRFAGVPLTPAWIQGSPFGEISSSQRIDATTERQAWKYIAETTSPITAVNARFSVTGTPGNFKFGIFADLNEAPDSATQLGDWTAEWAAPANGTYTGDKTLATNTGNLTIGTTYWVVCAYSSGTCDGSNYISAQGVATYNNSLRTRHYNGTNWTTTGASTAFTAGLILSHADGTTYDGGTHFTGSWANSASALDVYVNAGSNQVQGIKFTVGSKSKLLGVSFQTTKTGTPNNLVITVHSGNAAASVTETITAAALTSNATHYAPFTTPAMLDPDVPTYIIFSQTGTSDSNDYDLRIATFSATYINANLPPDMRFVYGVLSGTALSSLTVSTTEFPLVIPIVGDIATDLDCAAGSGGPPVFVGGCQ